VNETTIKTMQRSILLSLKSFKSSQQAVVKQLILIAV
jgi:hypothetical protein